MIDEIVTNPRISDEFISHEVLVAKINELIRAQNAGRKVNNDLQGEKKQSGRTAGVGCGLIPMIAI
jgi:hypothetical protein